jgi:hypothetical protein
MKNMTEYQEARWIALMDCVYLISEQADKINTDFDKIQFNHPAILHYIDEPSDQVVRVLSNKKRVG